MRLVRGGVSAGLVEHFQSEREVSNCELSARSRRDVRRFDSSSPHQIGSHRLIETLGDKGETENGSE